MNILVTNDDGYLDAGIRTLVNCLKKAGHKVFVIAPKQNQSGVSHSISMKPLLLEKISDDFYALSGTPADCVIAGIYSSLFNEKIDFVVSGINDGGNIGTDIIYSGTCAAARQACLYHVPSVALSLTFFRDVDTIEKKIKYYEKMAHFFIENEKYLCDLAKKDDCASFVNVNAYSFDDWKGMRFSKTLSNRKYEDEIIIKRVNIKDGLSENGHELYETDFVGNAPVSSDEETGDYYACKRGYVAVSRVLVQPTSVVGD